MRKFFDWVTIVGFGIVLLGMLAILASSPWLLLIPVIGLLSLWALDRVLGILERRAS